MLEFVVDHIVDYRTYVVTPVGYRKALPFCPTQFSEHMVGDRYKVRRDGCHDFLLIVTKEGAGYMSQRGQTVQLTAGTAVVIDCEPYQTYGTVEGGTWHFRYFHFTALSMEGFRNSLLSKLTVVNISDFEYLESTLKRILGIKENKDVEYKMENPIEILSSPLEEMVDIYIKECLEQMGFPSYFLVERLNVDEKIKVVKYLQEKGTFKVKGAIVLVAEKLAVSEPTIYRYLKKM